MVAVICFPVNTNNYPFAKIYRADSSSSTFTLIDTVNARSMEYQDENGDYSKYYKVSFSDGETETSQASVNSLAQNVNEAIRTELKLTEAQVPSSSIDYYIAQAKIDIQLELCAFKVGVQIFSISPTIYKLPGRFYYDLNCGGVVSVLDFTFYKQTLPISIGTPKVPVVPVYVDPEEFYVELAEPLAINEILKFNYFTADRRIPGAALTRLLAYRICSIYYTNLLSASAASGTGDFNSIRIGDISLSRSSGGSSTTNSTKDVTAKINAGYERLLKQFKTKMVRVN